MDIKQKRAMRAQHRREAKKLRHRRYVIRYEPPIEYSIEYSPVTLAQSLKQAVLKRMNEGGL